MLKPRHSENHGVDPYGGDVKSMALGNASDRDIEGDFAI